VPGVWRQRTAGNRTLNRESVPSPEQHRTGNNAVVWSACFLKLSLCYPDRHFKGNLNMK
jgi:hypothetical protein